MDTNGPIYQRTGVVLGNVVVTGVNVADTRNPAWMDFGGDIVAQDLHVVRVPFSKLENGTEVHIIGYKVLGWVELGNPNPGGTMMPTTDGIPMDFSVEFSTDGNLPLSGVCLLGNALEGIGSKHIRGTFMGPYFLSDIPASDGPFDPESMDGSFSVINVMLHWYGAGPDDFIINDSTIKLWFI